MSFQPVTLELVSRIAEEPERPTQPPKPTATPEPSRQPAPERAERPTGSSIEGTATWYCLEGRSRCPRSAKNGLYAAISPELLWLRGEPITVCYRSSCVVVTVIDCNCQAFHSVDLFAEAFAMLAPLDRGRIPVTIYW